MRKAVILPGLICLHFVLSAQQGQLPVPELMKLSKGGPLMAMDELVKQHGFATAEFEVPAENTAQNSDTSVYFTWSSADQKAVSNVYFNAKRRNGIPTNLCSLTTTDSLYYQTELKNLESGDFKLSDVEIKSEDAMEGKVFMKDDYRIKIFWSFMGSDIKFYVIDVIWFGK